MGQTQDEQDSSVRDAQTQDAQTQDALAEDSAAGDALTQDPNVTAFLQGIQSFDVESAPRIDLSRVLRGLRGHAGAASQADLLRLTGLDQQVLAATVTAMTSMGLVTVSGDSPVARVAFTPLGVQAADTVG